MRRSWAFFFRLAREVQEAFLRTEKTQALFRGSLGSSILWAASLGVRFLMGIALVRMLGAANYGTYAYALSWLGFLALPAMLGLDQIMVRFVAVYTETRSWDLLAGVLRFGRRMALRASAVVALVGMLSASAIPGIPSALRQTLVVSLAIVPVVVLANVRQASLRGLNRPIIAQLPDTIVNPILQVALLFALHQLFDLELTAPTAAVANAGAWVIALGMGILLLTRTLPNEVTNAIPRSDRPEWSKMIGPLVVTAVVYQLFSRGELFVLGILVSSSDVGLYAVAVRTAEQTMLLPYTAVSLAGPSLFSSIYASGDMQELQRFTSLVTRLLLWVSFPAYVVLMVAAPWLLSLYGSEFVMATGVIRIWLTAFMASTLCGFVIVMLYMTGHQRDVAIWMSLAAAANIVLSLALIPPMGLVGAALASGFSLIALHGVLVFVLYKRVGILSLPLSTPIEES